MAVTDEPGSPQALFSALQGAYIHFWWGFMVGILFPFVMEMFMLAIWNTGLPAAQVGPPVIVLATAVLWYVEFHQRLRGTQHNRYKNGLTFVFFLTMCGAWFGSLVNRPNKAFAPPEGGE